MASPRILVTCALGNVGREVARECASRGFRIRVSHHSDAPLMEHYREQERVRVDFADPGTWAPALVGCDFLFLVRPPPVGKMETTLNPFVDCAFASGVKHIVFLSVAGADRMKWVPHAKVEAHLRGAGEAWTVLRPGFFAQNMQDAYRRDIVEESRLYVPAGEGRVAFLDVRDVAEVAARVFESPAEHRGQAHTLTGPEAITFRRAAELLTDAIGKPVTYVPASVPGYAYHLWRRRKLSIMQIVVQSVLHVGLRKGDAAQVDATLERLLGRPARSMEEYVRHAAATWRPRALAFSPL